MSAGPAQRLRRALSGARTRLLASLVLLLALSSILSVVLIGRILDARAGDRVRDALVQEVDEFRRLADHGIDPRTGQPFGEDLGAIFRVFIARNVPAEGETLATFLNGRIYLTVSSARGGRPSLGDYAEHWGSLTKTERGDLETADGDVFRYLAVPVRRGRDVRGAFVVIAAHEGDEVSDALVVVAGVLGGVLLLASLFAWSVAGRVLAPLRLLSDTARSITETDLTRRIAVSGNDEIAELSRTFNAMLNRLETAFGGQRAFINDASHELRTPITIVRGHLELLGDDPGERRETLALVMDELDRMSRFVDDLLLLAKAGHTDFVKRGEVELGDLTDELLAKARALGRRQWQLDARARGRLSADRHRLTQAMMGLAENAAQHTEFDAPIALGSALADGEARLWVRDEGPGIAPEDQERIFERFARARAGRRRSEGAGLGLAIVQAIAEAHGGRVELRSRPGAGATFTIVLPTHNGAGPRP